ncbi:MAG: hypothetical protein MJZ68_05170 [archaeon]|nr:hypothetical protein [archaeon]
MDENGRYGWPLSARMFEYRYVQSVLEDLSPVNVLDPYCTGSVELVCAYEGVRCTGLSSDPFMVDLVSAKVRVYGTEGEEEKDREALGLLSKVRSSETGEDIDTSMESILSSMEPQPYQTVSVYEADPRDLPCPIKGYDSAITFLPRFGKTDGLLKYRKVTGHVKREYPEGDVLPVCVEGLNEKDIVRLGLYLSDLKEHLLSLRYALDPGSESVYVVSDTCIGGTYIFFEELVPDLMEECGFTVEDVEKVRVRDARRGAEDFQITFGNRIRFHSTGS